MAPPSETFEPQFHDIYPGIAPSNFVGSNVGKVVFITGASKGLGLASAKAYAQTGASLFITARSAPLLKQARRDIEAEFKVLVGYATVDVSNAESVQAGVQAAVDLFGRIDIVISNAGGNDAIVAIGEANPVEWWSTVEVNFKGSFLVARYSIPELEKTKGYIIFLSSAAAQARLPKASAYSLSKHITNRLAEWVVIDHGDKGIKSFSIHPGSVATELGLAVTDVIPALKPLLIDTPELSAWSEVRLTSGSEDWLSGRYFDCNWGFDAVEKLRDSIVDDDALKNRLALPSI